MLVHGILAGLDPPQNLYYSSLNGDITVHWDQSHENLRYLVLVEFGKNEILKRFTENAEFHFDELTELQANFKEFRMVEKNLRKIDIFCHF